jgi:hypothetical protein
MLSLYSIFLFPFIQVGESGKGCKGENIEGDSVTLRDYSLSL